MRGIIISFKNNPSEGLYEGYLRYKSYLDNCPNHRLPYWLITHTFYGGLNIENRMNLDTASNGSFLSYTYDEAWNLIIKMREATANLKDRENVINSFFEYACINDFLVDERTDTMIKTEGIDSYSVKKIIENYAGHLQVPTEWEPRKPLEEKKHARALMEEFSYIFKGSSRKGKKRKNK